jgi:hypothetical protein
MTEAGLGQRLVKTIRSRMPYRIALVLGALVAAWLLTPRGAHADSRRIPPWCAYMGGSFGYDCSYFTFEQCMETARGLGNSCAPNPSLGTTGPPRQKRRRDRN